MNISKQQGVCDVNHSKIYKEYDFGVETEAIAGDEAGLLTIRQKIKGERGNSIVLTRETFDEIAKAYNNFYA